MQLFVSILIDHTLCSPLGCKCFLIHLHPPPFSYVSSLIYTISTDIHSLLKSIYVDQPTIFIHISPFPFAPIPNHLTQLINIPFTVVNISIRTYARSTNRTPFPKQTKRQNQEEEKVFKKILNLYLRLYFKFLFSFTSLHQVYLPLPDLTSSNK